jgi:hypothetical protein
MYIEMAKNETLISETPGRFLFSFFIIALFKPSSDEGSFYTDSQYIFPLNKVTN